MNPSPSAPAEERAVLGACLLSDIAIEDTSHIVTPSDFHSPNHQAIYAAILAVYEQGNRLDIVAVHKAIEGSDVDLEYLNKLQMETPAVSNAGKHALTIAEAKVRRELIYAGSLVRQLGTGELAATDAADAADRARQLLANIDMPAGKGAPDPNVDTFIGSVDTTYDWLIDDFLERRDRMLVTAAEGMGKSLLNTQIGFQTAAGIHPWNLRPTTPRNVLLIDLENGSRLVTRRLDKLRHQAPQLDPERLRIHCRPQGIDLTTRTDRRWLIDRCQANNTELLVIGPAYRMAAGVASKGDVGGEDQARTVTAALDEVRNRCDVALILETHAPHGHAGGRDLRPFGSSVWLRWPEFGIGFASSHEHRDEFKVSHWRGPRDERIWPTALRRGAGRWPWTPVMPDGTFRAAS